jgi:hypothetical protein
LSRPEIAIHKKHLYGRKHEASRYLKRTQRDYSISLKLQIVKEIERGKLSTLVKQAKNYGIQSRSTVVQLVKKIW